MNARDIAHALKAKRSGRQWSCCCPAHDDHNPSLIFWDGDKPGVVRFKCYSGCDPRDVLAALRHRGLLDDHERRGGSNGAVAPTVAAQNRDRQKREDDERESAHNLQQAECIWSKAGRIEGTPGAVFFSEREIDITLVPDFGGLRWHPKCPWGSDDTAPCIVGRFTDAITGEPRGIWRRPIDEREPKAMALGPMAGCVIRLWPDDAITTGLVLGEGVETTLAAALRRVIHRGTFLQPAWAAGCADNMASFPVLAGIRTLTLLVDNDENSTGQKAAAECARRWVSAEREVIRLTPREFGADFNDIVMGKRHDR
jgi:hypothetical protein